MATVQQGPSVGLVQENPSLSLHPIDFRYEPFPIGFAANVISPLYYNRLLDAWPAQQLFAYKPQYGNKYSLSPVNNAELYWHFIKGSEPWLLFYRLIESSAFIDYVLETLRNYNIELGLTSDQLTSRFEFSMLSGNGGHIVPHTDAPQKVITLVIYMGRGGEWNSAYGGGTSALRAKDPRKNYNNMNINIGFDEVECLHTYPFVPNGCVVFIKTFNSYHAVYPIQGREDLPRKSVTINIECKEEPRLAYLRHSRAKFRLQ